MGWPTPPSNSESPVLHCGVGGERHDSLNQGRSKLQKDEKGVRFLRERLRELWMAVVAMKRARSNWTREDLQRDWAKP